MHAFLSIKYHADLRNKALIEAISDVLHRLGIDTLCIIRDLEAWGSIHYPPHELMREAFAAIDRCDFVLVELSEKGVGVGIEAGYAYARKTPLVVLAANNADISESLEGIATLVLRYDSLSNLDHVLQQITTLPAKQPIFPSKRMAAGALLRNEQGQILIVKPGYRDDWLIPGGVIEEHESPRQACIREVQEEIGLTCAISQLGCVEYQSTDGAKTENVQWIFDGGILSQAQIEEIVLQPEELEEYRFVELEEALALLNKKLGRRVKHILQREAQEILYIENGNLLRRE